MPTRFSRRQKRKLRQRLWAEHRELTRAIELGSETEAQLRKRLIDQYWPEIKRRADLRIEHGPMACDLAEEVDEVLGLGLRAELNGYLERLMQPRRPNSPRGIKR